MNKQEALRMLYRNQITAFGSYELGNNYITLGSDNELIDKNDNYVSLDDFSEFDDYFDASDMMYSDGDYVDNENYYDY